MSPTISLTNTSISEAANEPADFSAYVARPEGAPQGAVIVIHEIWGLVDHITGIADRLAAEGYLAVAPDLLSSIGIDKHIGLELHDIMFSPDEKVRIDGQPRLRDALSPLRSPGYGAWAVGSMKAVVDWIETQDGVDGRIAITGFCFGGSQSFALAAHDDRIRAAIPFYGTGPDPESLAGISCPVLALYGGEDAPLIDALPDLTARMKAASVDFRPHVYEGSRHAFFNDTNPITFNAESAADAWGKLLAFLDENLVR